MQRREFIKKCNYACLAMSVPSILLQSCSITESIPGNISGSDLIFPLSNFKRTKGGQIKFKKYVVVDNPELKFPICVFRLNENKYSALLMRCTHQGTELEVYGNGLECPAHGSEFSDTGRVLNGPADKHLRTFPVKIENNNVKISLK